MFEDSREIVSENVSISHIIGGLVVLSVIVIGRVFVGNPSWSYVEIVPGIVSGIFTFGLLLIYLLLEKNEEKQTEIQEEQTEIQEEQTEIQDEQTETQKTQTEIQKKQTKNQELQTEIQDEQTQIYEQQMQLIKQRNTPYLIIKDFNYTKKTDRLQLIIKNLGDVPARDLRVTVEAEFFKWNSDKRELDKAFDNGSGLGLIETVHPRKVKESRDDTDLEIDNYLDSGEEETFEIELNFPVLGGDQGFYSPDNANHPQGIRPYDLVEAASIILKKDKVGITINDRNEQGTFSYMGFEEYYDKIPFDRLKLTFQLDFHERAANEEVSYEVILPLREPRKDKSSKIWNLAMEYSKYQQRILKEISSQYDDVDYDAEKDPILNQMEQT